MAIPRYLLDLRTYGFRSPLKKIPMDVLGPHRIVVTIPTSLGVFVAIQRQNSKGKWRSIQGSASGFKSITEAMHEAFHIYDYQPRHYRESRPYADQGNHLFTCLRMKRGKYKCDRACQAGIAVQMVELSKPHKRSAA